MFRKFEKTKRIKVPQYDIKGKFFLSDDEFKELCSGDIVIEEKLDGANVGVIRKKQDPGFALQKRGSLVGPSEHAQFNYFVNWAHLHRDQIMRMKVGEIAYFELLYARHNIPYDKLWDYLVLLEVYDGRHDRYLPWHEKDDYARDKGFVRAPVVCMHRGIGRKEIGMLAETTSFFYDGPAEGIVVKNAKHPELRGKIVRPDFMKELDEDDHWMRRPCEKNALSALVETSAYKVGGFFDPTMGGTIVRT